MCAFWDVTVSLDMSFDSSSLIKLYASLTELINIIMTEKAALNAVEKFSKVYDYSPSPKKPLFCPSTANSDFKRTVSQQSPRPSQSFQLK